jgi:MoxR-like ATPase
MAEEDNNQGEGDRWYYSDEAVLNPGPDQEPPEASPVIGELNPGTPVISQAEVDSIAGFYRAILHSLGRLIIGNESLIRHIFIALLSSGHILIEGPPGTAKTVTTKAIAHLTSCEFSRVQAAVDLQPADIIGVRILNRGTNEFEFKKGALFTNILMIDEINRLSPKTQGAFIEAMSERQVTVDGITMELPRPFFVIATQNPYEFEGTFPLIEVQRDRFMFYHKSDYMDAENELEIINRADEGKLDWPDFQESQGPVIHVPEILHYRSVIDKVFLSDELKRYIRDIILATRQHSDAHLGSSSRGSLALVRGAKSTAAIHGRTYVIPDDIKGLAMICLAHRIVLTREAIIGNISASQLIQEIIDTIEVP